VIFNYASALCLSVLVCQIFKISDCTLTESIPLTIFMCVPCINDD